MEVWLINGIPGSGKTTTARELANRFPRSVHLEGDKLQDFIISGNVPPGGSPKEEEAHQIHLNIKHQCLLASSFIEAGFVPVIDYVVVNQARVEEYKSWLGDCIIYFVTLKPGTNVALERDKNRPEKTVAAQWIHLDGMMKKELKEIGLWVDNSDLTCTETVDLILKNKEKAKLEKTEEGPPGK